MSSLISTILDFLDEHIPWFRIFHESVDQALDGLPLGYIALGILIAVVIYFIVKPLDDK